MHPVITLKGYNRICKSKRKAILIPEEITLHNQDGFNNFLLKYN